jgi:Putative transposase
VQEDAAEGRALPPLCARCDGDNLHAGVVIEAEDGEGLERLGRYLLRPPLAQARLEFQADGSARFQMKRAYADGTQTLAFTAKELVARLIAIVPAAGANQRCTCCGGRMVLRHVVGGEPATAEVLERLQRAGVRSARAPP